MRSKQTREHAEKKADARQQDERAYRRIKDHAGHAIAVVRYGDEDATWNVAVECIDCKCVITDANNPAMEPR